MPCLHNQDSTRSQVSTLRKVLHKKLIVAPPSNAGIVCCPKVFTKCFKMICSSRMKLVSSALGTTLRHTLSRMVYRDCRISDLEDEDYLSSLRRSH